MKRAKQAIVFLKKTISHIKVISIICFLICWLTCIPKNVKAEPTENNYEIAYDGINFFYKDQQEAQQYNLYSISADLPLKFFDQYWNFKTKATHYDENTEITQALIQGKIGSYLIDLGKTSWNWGQGYVYQPTCQIDKNINLLGTEISWAGNSYNFALGATYDKDSTFVQNEWARFGKLSRNYDYSLIVSMCKAIITDDANWNGGLDFSCDFPNGLELYAGLNQNVTKDKFSYSLGIEYILSNNLALITEFYQMDSHYTVLMFNNHANVSNDWKWELREIFNTDNSCQIRMLVLKYDRYKLFMPELVITNYEGSQFGIVGINEATDSYIGSKAGVIDLNKTNWQIDLKLTFKFSTGSKETGI